MPPALRPPATLARLALAGLLGVACASGADPEPPGGSLRAAWVGADTGNLFAPAVAEWCDSLGLLELRAVSGDTGVALVLYPPDSVTSGDAVGTGDYRVIPPARGDSVRPSAAIALRYFAETSIRGFRGDTGTVTLEALGPGTGAGRFSAQLRSATEGSRLTVTGTFEGLTVTTAPAECAGSESGEPDEMDEYEEDDGDDGDDGDDIDPDMR